MIDKIKSDITSASSFNALRKAFRKHLPNQIPDTKAAKGRIKANQLAKDILDRVQGDYSLITDEEREQLREYSGFGGIGGSTNEYYTPKWVADAVWGSLAAYGFEGGKVLEPSAGVGIFSETKSENSLITSVEMSPTSSAINQILHPDDHVINSAFEGVATDPEIGGFDAVIGNPPYGDRDGNIRKDAQYKDTKRAELYFIERSVDKTRAGGLIALVLPTGVVDKKSLKKWRTRLSLKCEFLGAHRMPSGIFNDTEVTTDLVVWRKHSDELAELAQSADLETLEQSNVLWDTWLSGKWFEREGKRFIQGEQFIRGKGQFARKIVDRGNRSNEEIAKALSHRFTSRIDWGALDHVEPVSNKYNDGDTTFHNGNQMIMRDGEWQVATSRDSGGQIQHAKFGVDKISDISTITSSTNTMSTLTAAQAINLYDEYGYACDNQFKTIARNLKKLAPAQQEKAFKGIMLGKRIRTLQDMIANGEASYGDEVDQYRRNLGADIALHFTQNGNRKPVGLNKLDANLNADWLAYQTSISKGGKLSDLLKGDLTKEQTNQYDTNKIGDVLAFARNDLHKSTLFIDEIRQHYTHVNAALTDQQLLDELAQHEEVAINSDGSISAMHQATSGNVANNLARLNDQLGKETSPAIQENIKRQITTIDNKRNKIDLNSVQMKLTDKWIPKHIMLEFLHEQGYSHFQLGEHQADEDGYEDFVPTEHGNTFDGYRFKDGKKASTKGEEFERQVESYLNTGRVLGGSGNAGKALVRERMRKLDSAFTNWCASSGYAEQLEDDYNQRFANWIEPEHDDSDLNLANVSGSIEMMKFQNSTIRKHSEDGCGIVAFGTGLGKTLTALALGEHNLQTGRASRIAYVVPKSVLENWFYESDIFFGEQNLGNKVFIGVEAIKNKDGKLERETLLDEEGNPKQDASGKVIKRPKLNIDTSTKKIAPQLHDLAQSKARIVVMTKDVYNRLPMRDSTVSAHVEGMKEAGLVAGSNKYVQQADNYREAQKNAKFEAKYADEGTKKKEELPYFEDLMFDNVIVDEGHDFRNSYKGGSYGNRLAYLPNASQADRALDMQLKNNHIKSRNDGKGVYMLSATPTVNSPVDAFNMLSHILPADTFAKMGIVDSDDFIRLFARTGETGVTKLSGEVSTKEALLGFQNLEALRSIFSRHVTIKDIKDVSSDVHIPEIVAQTNYVDMSEEQAEIYEELRQRADALSNPEDPKNQEIVEEYPDDSVFSLIRQMDKACTDLDLYNGVITYRFAKGKQKKVQELLDKLPNKVKVKRTKLDDTGEPEINEKTGVAKMETVEVEVQRTATVVGKHTEVVLTQELGAVFEALADKEKLKFSHPVSPKYAKFLEKAKEIYLSGGKQLVFTEEKTQHKKIARIIADFVGCKISEIGILNSDTVAGKKGSRATEEDQEAGLEGLANSYNTGRYKFMVLNKKGEVGINLHHGTTDIHHLTLPWTPSSLTQRNGRGARVGSKAKKVNSHYYAGKGSFDAFRISTIERKAKWIQELFTGEESFVENGNMDDGSETAVMLAADPEQAKARIEQAKAAREQAILKESQRQAAINVSKYVQATIAASADVDSLKQRLVDLVDEIAVQQKETDERKERAKGTRRNSWEYDRYNDALDKLQSLKSEQAKTSRTIEAAATAQLTKQRLQTAINQSLEDGTLAGYDDIFTNAENYATKNGVVIRKGFTYHAKIKERSWDEEYTLEVLLTVADFDRAEGTVTGRAQKLENGTLTGNRHVSRLPIEQCYQLADVDQSRAELEALAASPIPLTDVAHKFDRDTFFELADQGKLKYYGSTSKPLVVSSTGEYHTQYSMEVTDGDTLVYPDVKDKATSKALLKQVVNDIEQKGRTNKVDSEILVFFIGQDWQQQAVDAGNKAVEEDVVNYVGDQIMRYEDANPDDLNKALRELHASYTPSQHRYLSDVTDEINDLDWKGYSNRQEIRTWSNSVLSGYRARMVERSKDHIDAARDKAFTDYRNLIANDSTRAARLKKIADVMSRFKQEHRVRNEIESIYGDDKAKAVIYIRADLASLGYDELQNGDELAISTRGEHSSAIWKWNSVFSMQKNAFISAVNESVQKEAPAITDKQQAKVDAINASDAASVEGFIKECDKLGIRVVELTSDLVWTAKRGRRTYNNSIPAYSKLALQDTNGTSGALKPTLAGKGNADRKETYGATYGADCGEGFEGSWWFIDSDADLSEFVTLLSEAA